MVETRSRRKSAAPAAAAAATTPVAAGGSGRGVSSGGADGAPSTSGRRAEAEQQQQQRQGETIQPAADGHVDYAELYRQAARRAKEEEQSSILRRLKGRVGLFYHQQAMTWGWYMLEPWETVLWMSTLAFLCWLVLSACFINPNSICSSALAAARRTLAAQGAKLLAFGRR